MTSAVAVIGLAFDDYDLQRPDLNVLFAITEGLDTLPAVRGADQLIPFRTGNLPSARIADRRSIVATGWLAGAAPAPELSYRAYLDGLKRVLDPTRPPAALRATLQDGSVRWINAVARSLIGGDMIGHEFRPMSIEWEALDPYWYSQWGTLTLDSGLYLDAGWYLDSSADVVITGTGPVVVDPLGTADVERVRVRFTGPSSGPVGLATQVVLPVGFSVARTLVAGEILEVDNYARTCLLNGVSVRNLMNLWPGNQHGEYIRLPPGPTPLLAAGGAAETRVSFTTTWL